MQLLNTIPLALNRLDRAPKQLYYIGDPGLLNRPKVAIVGSRRCSPYTKNAIFSLAATLKSYGIAVVSGGALGADIAAHAASMPLTIAVFANGLDIIYPPSNAKTIKEIYQNALAISEYAPQTSPRPENFLARNRIVVGLSDAVIIAQAELKSGSMSSAYHAKRAGIPIYCLPQRLGESGGTNALIASNQARLLSDFNAFSKQILDKKLSEPTLFDDSELFSIAPKPKKPNSVATDPLLAFISQNPNLNDALAKFGELIYEYELEGKIAIDGVFVRLL